MDPLIGQLLLQIILIFFNAVFACAEIAVISFNDNKLELLASQGDKRAQKLESLTRQPAKFLSTIQVGITFAGFLGSAFAADSFSDYIVKALSGISWISESMLKTISVVLVTLILSYFTLVLGELVPKRLAQRKSEDVALGMSGFLTFTSILFAPIVYLLTISTNGILRLFGIDPNENDETATEEEIRMMVDAGSEKGTIDENEKEIIQNVFEFDDTIAEEVMTHRTDCDILWMEESDDKWDEIIKSTRHSYYPICDDSVDNIIGILNAKVYLRMDAKNRQEVMDGSVSEPLFVTESVKLDDLFHTMQKARNHFAVVLDDYGGMSGVITMNDLLEELVGNLDEQGDIQVEVEPYLIKTGEKSWDLNGYVYLEDLINEIDYDIPEIEDCDTFGAYVFAQLGSIPDDGIIFEMDIENMHIKVDSIVDHCIESAHIMLKETANKEEE